MPSTVPGRWSVGLLAGFVVALGAFFLLVASGQRGGDTFFSNELLTAVILLAASLAIAGGLTGLHAIVQSRERAPLVIAATAIGVLVAAYALLEIVFEH
jgi:hypothetical protein